MPQRNMRKLAEKANALFLDSKNKYLSAYAMNIDELCELYRMCSAGKEIEAVSMAFNLGFCLGSRAHDRQRVPAL
jgi:hypothetical protein